MTTSQPQEQDAEAHEAPKTPAMVTIGMRLDPGLVARIDACAATEVRSRSELTRLIFMMAFEKYETEKKPLAELMLAHRN